MNLGLIGLCIAGGALAGYLILRGISRAIEWWIYR